MNKRRNLLNFKTIFGFVVVVLLIVVVVVLSIKNRTVYNDDYFVSDDTKIVLSMDARTSGFEESAYIPPITHVVYYYSGDEITSIKVFYEYKNEDIAKKANDGIKMDDKGWATNKALNGKYIIFDMAKDQFEGLTTGFIRNSVESSTEDGTFDRERSFLYGYNGEDILENND